MYLIQPLHFACKYWDDDHSKDIHLHMVNYHKCNFRCGYCNLANRPFERWLEYTPEEFLKKVYELNQQSRYYKFTGGEPTLNPRLREDLETVTALGGHIFLDTNGSRPTVLQDLFERGLVEVMGISMKGLTPEAAMESAAITNRRLCWDNVFESLALAERYEVHTIVTMVLFNDRGMEDVERFAEYIRDYKNVRLKINNLIEMDYQAPEGKTYVPLDAEQLERDMAHFVETHPEWKSRVVLINTGAAIHYADAIRFF